MSADTTENRFHYLAFGLHIESEIECPELQTETGSPDVRITLETIPKRFKENEDWSYFWRATPEYFFFTIKNIAQYLVIDGNRIIIEPQTNEEFDIIRIFLLGTCFGVILHQRGLLPLHGSGIATKNGCVIFSGPVGAGKSTIASAFQNKGYRIMADDVCAITISPGNRPLVQPAYPQLKIRSDSARKLALDTKQLHHVSSDNNKFRLPIAQNFQKKPLPLLSIFILDKHENERFSLEVLHGINKFKQLIDNTYRPALIDDLGLASSHFQNCSLILKEIPMYRILRPQSQFLLQEMVDYLERYFQDF